VSTLDTPLRGSGVLAVVLREAPGAREAVDVTPGAALAEVPDTALITRRMTAIAVEKDRWGLRMDWLSRVRHRVPVGQASQHGGSSTWRGRYHH
jgi:hypothetical protein